MKYTATKRSALYAVALVFLSLPSPLRAQGPTESPARQQHFTDEFTTDTRDQYEIRGPVQWEQGRLTIAEGAVLTKKIEPGNFIDFEMHLEHVAGAEGNLERELEIRFELESGNAVSVFFRRYTLDGALVNDIRLTKQTRGSKPEQIRRFTGDSELTFRPLGDRRMRIYPNSYCRGSLEIVKGSS